MDKNKLLLEDIMNPEVLKTITICGSSRFRDLKEKYQAFYTLKGNIVHAPVNLSLIENEMNTTPDEMQYNYEILHKIHEEKIMRSDAIIVVNPNCYYGKDTNREIIFARINKKPVIYTCVYNINKFIFNNNKTYPLYIKENGNGDE